MKIHRLFYLLAGAVFAAALVSNLRAADPAPATEITVAAAADLKFAFGDLVKKFNEQNPSVKVQAVFGSSGNFFAQIQNGAPFDLFFSADTEYPRKLTEAGLAVDDVFLYSIGQLVLWTPKGSTLDVEKNGIQALLDPAVHKIAIANPEHAPYGRAAVAALKSLKVYDQIAPKLVLGSNIAQTAQFVQSGAADIGVLALSLALAPEMKEGAYCRVPLDAYPKMEQGGMILKSSKNVEAARAFRDFVLSPAGKAALEHFGFSSTAK